jgi:hypothetical protein
MRSFVSYYARYLPVKFDGDFIDDGTDADADTAFDDILDVDELDARIKSELVEKSEEEEEDNEARKQNRLINQ